MLAFIRVALVLRSLPSNQTLRHALSLTSLFIVLKIVLGCQGWGWVLWGGVKIKDNVKEPSFSFHSVGLRDLPQLGGRHLHLHRCQTSPHTCPHSRSIGFTWSWKTFSGLKAGTCFSLMLLCVCFIACFNGKKKTLRERVIDDQACSFHWLIMKMKAQAWGGDREAVHTREHSLISSSHRAHSLDLTVAEWANLQQVCWHTKRRG